MCVLLWIHTLYQVKNYYFTKYQHEPYQNYWIVNAFSLKVPKKHQYIIDGVNCKQKNSLILVKNVGIFENKLSKNNMKRKSWVKVSDDMVLPGSLIYVQSGLKYANSFYVLNENRDIKPIWSSWLKLGDDDDDNHLGKFDIVSSSHSASLKIISDDDV